MNAALLCESYLGGCPECGECHILNVGSNHWGTCAEHLTKWSIESNLFSGWHTESVDTWDRNWALLATYDEVEPLPEGAPLPGTGADNIISLAARRRARNRGRRA